MKLIFAVVNGDDASTVRVELIKADYHVTQLSSTGGFLRRGNTTFITAVEDEKVDDVLEIIHKYSKKRTYHTSPDMMAGVLTPSMEVTIGGATVFITDIERFERF